MPIPGKMIYQDFTLEGEHTLHFSGKLKLSREIRGILRKMISQ